MSSSITISVNAQDFVLNAPEWGYVTDINLALIHVPHLPRGYAIWDNGILKDYRTVSLDWLLNATDTNTLLGIFDTLSKGRGQSFNLNLGTNSGFYPFGPDLGDSGIFQCRILNVNTQPVLEEPWLWFKTQATMVMETSPSYSLPTEIDEGDITIGTVSGLRFPPNMPQSENSFGYTTQLTYTGVPYTVDKTINSDSDTTTLDMVCNQSKAAALIDHMVGTVRDANLNITDNANGYFFGRKAGEDNTYVCQWLDSKISITHSRFDEFSFGLTFYRVSTS